MSKVAALYIDPRGPYPKLIGPEMCWDEVRDARTYVGPWPVIAHPPCGAWSALRHLRKLGQDKSIALLAIEQVYQWGGVLEHPIASGIWEMVSPTVIVEQCDFGHVARKRTGLLLVGCRPGPLPPKRNPTHWCSGGRTRSSRKGSAVPAGIKVCSAQQRRRTPVAFAEWLIALASTVEMRGATEKSA